MFSWILGCAETPTPVPAPIEPTTPTTTEPLDSGGTADTATPWWTEPALPEYELDTPATGTPTVGVIGDQDGDGSDDLVVSVGTSTWVVRSPPTTDLVEVALEDAVLSASAGVAPGRAGDHDGDGRPDLWFLGEPLQLVTSLPADGAGVALVDHAAASVAVSPDPAQGGVDALLSPGDLDGDGELDLLVSDTETYTIRWFDGPFVGPQAIDDVRATWTGTQWVNGEEARGELASIGDVTGDGLPDVLIGGPYAERAWLVSDPPRSDVPLSSLAVAEYWRAGQTGSHVGSWLGSGDLDGDGLREVAIADEYGSDGATLFFTSAASGLVDLDQSSLHQLGRDDLPGGQCTGAAVADFDGDGQDDVALGCPNEGYWSQVFLAYGPLAPGRWSMLGTAERLIQGSVYDDLGQDLLAVDLNHDDNWELVLPGARDGDYWARGLGRLLVVEVR
ncbi:MAG: VCBS repeat-containing protein [Myxococcota bacterium]